MTNTTLLRTRTRIAALTAAGALLIGAGCASNPPQATSAELGSARTAVAQAEDEGAATHAPTELANARQKLDRAEAALEDERYVEADRLASQAQIDAQLAEYKTQTAEARAAVAEINDTIETLRAELERAAN